METIRITTGAYKTADYRIVKEYKNRKSAQKFIDNLGCKCEIFNGLNFSNNGTTYTISIG